MTVVFIDEGWCFDLLHDLHEIEREVVEARWLIQNFEAGAITPQEFFGDARELLDAVT